MRKIAVIVAGGSGQRMGSTIPKQFLMLKEKPILLHTIYAFIAAFADIEIVLVLPEEYLPKGRELCNHLPIKINIIKGGNTRFQSVKNGLHFVEHFNSIVFVHDAVRCLVTPQLIKNCYEQTIKKGSAVPAVTATDSIRFVIKEDESEVVDRSKVRIIQTPQTFTSEILLPAFEQTYNESFTDEATVVEAYGQTICLIEGDYDNLKITRPIDLLIAERILEEHY